LSSRPAKNGKSFADKLVAFLILLVGIGIPVVGGWFIYTNYGDDIAEMIKKPFSAMPPTTNDAEPAAASRIGETPAVAERAAANTPASNPAPASSSAAAQPQASVPPPVAQQTPVETAPTQAPSAQASEVSLSMLEQINFETLHSA
jgi:hypothetical protein